MRRLAVVAAVLCGLATSGCSYQLNSMFSKDGSDVDQTGSIGRPGDQADHVAVAAQPSEVDLAYARAAASEILARGSKDSSVPWENPHTGASGNITPLASSSTEGGLPCRGFLASYGRGKSEDWLQGVACRTRQGRWEVKRLKPLRRS